MDSFMSSHTREEFDALTEHEELPFALTGEHGPQHQRIQCCPSSPSTGQSLSKYGEMSSCSPSNSHNYQPPLLASSVISSPSEAESQASSVVLGSGPGASSLLRPDSQLLDTAASMLLPTSSALMTHSLSSLSGGFTSTPENAVTSRDVQDSIRFSQLMKEADDSQPIRSATISRLPALEEEQSLPSSTSILASSSTVENLERPIATRQVRSPRWSTFESSPLASSPASTTFQSTILMAAESVHAIPVERRLATLAGATARLTGPKAFKVSVELLTATCTVRDAMDILGNPDFLRLWCDPVQGVVITNSSEGARTAENPRGPTEEGRQYEGEWIEATTPQLIHPNRTSCFYSTSLSLSTAFGFPSYGKVTMFVERQHGRVGLSIGRFAGGYEVAHQIKVEEDGSKIRITDDIRIRREGDGDSRHPPSYCGLVDAVESIFLPQTEDYMDQALSGMARLRFLLENGQHRGLNIDHVHLLTAEGPSSSEPLLPGR